MADKKDIVKYEDRGPILEGMEDHDTLQRQILDVQLENEKLKSLMRRMCHWIVQTRSKEQELLTEAKGLLNLD